MQAIMLLQIVLEETIMIILVLQWDVAPDKSVGAIDWC